MDRRQLMLTGMAAFLARYLPTARAEESASTAIAKACNAFAIDYYGQIRAQEGNLFYSPFSIASAVGMTTLGAAGDTRDQMLAAFHRNLDPNASDAGFAEVLQHLNADDKDPKSRGYQLSVANAIWGQKDEGWKREFLVAAEKFYQAGLREVDFVKNPEAARKTVNAWVEEKTHQKIKDLIKSGMITPLTRMILTNAIYFKGDWATQFKKEQTREGAFFLDASKTAQTPLMNRKGDFPLFESPDLQALELPYKGKELGMVVLLPRKKDGLSAIEKGLTAPRIQEIVKGMRERKDVQLTLPKFKIEKELNLSEGLKALGMKDAWIQGKANFSGLNGRTDDLYISAAVHKAFVEVNEEGTEAAAATAVIVATRSIPVTPVFRADHPFLFFIRDRKTDVILFMGRVANPAA